MTDCSGVIKIRQSRLKHLVLVLLALLLVFASYHLLTGDFSGSDFAQHVEILIFPVGAGGIAFFGTVAIYAIYRLFNFRYALIISPSGFTDCSTLAALGFVGWEKVEKISVCTIAKQKFVGVEIRNIKKILADKFWYVRRLTMGNVAVGYPPITINLNSSREKPEEVLAIMTTYWEAWKKSDRNSV